MLNDKFIPIVLCAGFGTRLKPITDHIPKVICPIIDKPLAFFSIEKFFEAGFEKVYCNTHYKSEMVENELKACAESFEYNPNRLEFIHEPEILGSGGGILNIVQKLHSKNSQNISKDIIVVSGDIVADFPLKEMVHLWEQKKKNDLALMLSVELDQDRDDVLCVSEDGNTVIGFGKDFIQNNKKVPVQKRMFSNHQIISSKLFQNQKVEFCSSVDLFYKRILNSPEKVILHSNFPQDSFWFNVGDIAEYQKCLRYFCEKRELKYPPEYKMYYRPHEMKAVLSSIFQLNSLMS